MAEDETVETIDAAGVEGAPQDFFVIAAAAGIKEPIGASRTDVHRGTRTKVEDGDLRACAGRPLRSRDIQMATGEDREGLHKSKDQFERLQLALLNTRDREVENGATTNDMSATASTQKATGTTARFASSEIGVIR